jgi:hypothetical protein
MRRNDEISTIGHPISCAQAVDWEDDSTTLVEPFLLTVRKMEAPPSDDLEELETVRGELHQRVDRLVDRALESVSELRAMVERTEEQRDLLTAELECVVRHSNALVEATAPEPRRRKSTVIGFPTTARKLAC